MSLESKGGVEVKIMQVPTQCTWSCCEVKFVAILREVSGEDMVVVNEEIDLNLLEVT